jgi:hypothetical protein
MRGTHFCGIPNLNTKIRWENNIKIGASEMGCENMKHIHWALGIVRGELGY